MLKGVMDGHSSQSWRRDWAALAALMLAYAGLFAAYYPPLPGIEDEVGFVNQPLVWSRGAISAEGAGLPGWPTSRRSTAGTWRRGTRAGRWSPCHS